MILLLVAIYSEALYYGHCVRAVYNVYFFQNNTNEVINSSKFCSFFEFPTLPIPFILILLSFSFCSIFALRFSFCFVSCSFCYFFTFWLASFFHLQFFPFLFLNFFFRHLHFFISPVVPFLLSALGFCILRVQY